MIVITIGYLAVYMIFENQLVSQVEKITKQVFAQAEISLRAHLERSEAVINSLLSQTAVKEFLEETPHEARMKVEMQRSIIASIDEILRTSPALYSIAIVNTDADVIGASRRRTVWKEAAGDIQTRAVQTRNTLHWSFEQPLLLGAEDDFLSELFDVSLIYGTRCVQIETIHGRQSYYVIVTMQERSIAQTYGQLLYDDSTAMIVDREGRVISCNQKEWLGEQIDGRTAEQRRKNVQTVSYASGIQEWTFYNMIPNAAYRDNIRALRVLILCVYVMTFIVFILFVIAWVSYCTRPVEHITQGIEQVARGDLHTQVPETSGIEELDHAARLFNRMIERIQALIDQNLQMEEEKRKEEIKTLQYQINPHFLYNSINSIRWMAMAAGAPSVADSLVILTRLIRPIFKDPSFFWPVEEEIEFVKHYIAMMTLRFKARLTYHISVDEALAGYSFPRFVLQPMIENCFTHALGKSEALHVEIRIRLHGDEVNIEIEDDAGGVPPGVIDALNASFAQTQENPAGEKIGLRNVNRRVALLYHTQNHLHIESDERTIVQLKLPYRPGNSEDAERT